jgi:hypothetical protein
MHKETVGKHPLGLDFGCATKDCGECAWSKMRGPGPKVLRCLAAQNRRVEAKWRSCNNWEAALSCLDCAACCGPAYDVVEVSPRDPVRHSQPDWIVKKEGRYQMKRRKDNHCRALLSDNRCQIYEDRPRCCRDFSLGAENCLFARRRLGFTRGWR